MTSSPVAATDRAAATFPAEPTSARAARELATAALARWGALDLVDEVSLLVSELVTNAVIHAGTTVEVSLTLHGGAVEVAVTDRHPTRRLPTAPPESDPDREGGRGLALVASLAPSWGVDYTDRTKRVWFRMPLPGGAVPVPRDSVDDAMASTVLSDGGPTAELAIATVRLDAAGAVTDLDVHAEQLLGRPREEVLARPWLSLCAPEDAGELVSAAAVARWQGSYRLLMPDGSHRWVAARHVTLAAAGPHEAAATLCVLVDHRLRVLLTGPAPAGAARPRPDGPFADDPDLLVRVDLDTLLERSVAWAREALDGDSAYALLVTEDEDELELRAAVGSAPGGRRWRLPVDAAVPQLYGDLQARPDADGWLRETGARSAVRVPLIGAGRQVGTLIVTADRTDAFSVADGTRLQRAADSVALAVQSARVTEIDRRRHGWLGFLAEASELLAGTLELDMALALVAQLVTPRLGPWCAIHLTDAAGRMEPAIVWHSDEERIDELRAELSSPNADVQVRAHIVPLVARGREIGRLLVGAGQGATGGAGAPRPPVHLLADLAPRVALALDNARLYAERTDTSRTLQRSLLPPELPSLPGVQLGVVYEATGAGNEVGGDFYDIFATDGDTFAFAVGDVCGKGPAAAAVTGLARTVLRVLGRRGDDVQTVLHELNATILAEGERSRFLTLVYGVGGPMDGDGLELRLACAGHPRPRLLRADGAVAPAGVTGDLLGIFAEPETPVTTIRLAPGESLVCFTDGVTERRSGPSMLGEDGVERAVLGCQDLPAPALARRLGTAVRTFASEPARDDVAILVLRAEPVRPPRPPG